jgi:N-acetylglucosaminyldiphosphoundecaprenol N-acetyl-beta-D-mannosaminyltransferase
VDAVDQQHALSIIIEAITHRRPLFLSTPNLNFLVGCLEDGDFRRSLVCSDLSTADGMPLVWLSRLLGIPLSERVAGSALVESLGRRTTDRPIRVFFFGGAAGVASLACARLGASEGNLHCVGYCDPGFGSIESMSAPALIEAINQSEPDFLMVALGAAKGQAWLMRNLPVLDVPVVSHLGAVVNFIAGTVSRAPRWMQRAGLEWLWRIKEEPSLWRRYLSDGLALFSLLFGRVLPFAFWLQRNRKLLEGALDCEIRREHEGAILVLRGACSEKNSELLAEAAARALAEGPNLTIDMRDVCCVDPRSLGVLLVLEGIMAERRETLRVTAVAPRLRRVLRWNGMEHLVCGDTRVQAQGESLGP